MPFPRYSKLFISSTLSMTEQTNCSINSLGGASVSKKSRKSKKLPLRNCRFVILYTLAMLRPTRSQP